MNSFSPRLESLVSVTMTITMYIIDDHPPDRTLLKCSASVLLPSGALIVSGIVPSNWLISADGGATQILSSDVHTDDTF